MKKNYALNKNEVENLDCSNTYLAIKIDNSSSKNSDQLYFTSEENATKIEASTNQKKFVAVSFPESQLFLDNHTDSVYLINDDKGIEAFGNSAYFVDKELYQEVRKAFEKEMNIAVQPNSLQKGRCL